MNPVRNWVNCMDMWLVIEYTEAEHYTSTGNTSYDKYL